MNPFLLILILLFATLLWFTMSFTFDKIGDIAIKLWNKVVGIMKNEKEKDNER